LFLTAQIRTLLNPEPGRPFGDGVIKCGFLLR
jgi:hypothetical protein